MIKFKYETSGISDEIISTDHFGVNLIGQYESPGDVKGWQNFDEVVNAAGATTLRWPGGVDAERNHEENVAIKQYLGDGLNAAQNYLESADALGDTSFREACAFAAEDGRDITFIIPTNPLMNGSGVLLSGGALAAAKVELKTYLENVLDIAIDEGVNISAFEVGNEYWGLWGRAYEYGKSAAVVADVLNEVLSDNEYSTSFDPDVLVQIYGDTDGTNLSPADLEHRNSNTLAGFQYQGGDVDLIDGAAAHFYYKAGKETRTDNDGIITHSYENIDDRIAFFNELLAPWKAAKTVHEMELHFTEWSVQHKIFGDVYDSEGNYDLEGNDNELVTFGLKQIAPTLEMFTSMINLGVDAAQVWAATTNLAAFALNPGAATVENGEGLNVIGQFFAQELTTLAGYHTVDLDGGDENIEVTYDVHMFTKTEAGDDNTGRVYLSSLKEGSQDLDLDLLGLWIIPGTVTISILGVQDASDVDVSYGGVTLQNVPDFLQPGAILETTVLENMDIDMKSGTLSNLNLGSYEIAKIEFEMFDRKIVGENVRDVLTGEFATDDLIYTRGGNDWVRTGDGRDYVDGGDGNDALYGGAGDDILVGGNGNDYIDGGAGAYSDYIYGGNGDDKLWGREGTDTLHGGSGNDKLYGGSGNDYLRDDGGADYFDGGAGSDTASYYGWYSSSSANTKTLKVNLSTGYNNSADTYYSIENLMGSNTQKDHLTGTGGANTLNGLGGDDKLYGLGGNDTLKGGDGNDTLTGGDGADTFFFSDGDGTDTVTDFDFDLDTIKLNDDIFNPANPPSGSTVVQSGSNVLITYSGGVITLENVDLSAWAPPAPTPTVDGTDGDDVIYLSYVDAEGDSASDGADIIYGYEGDDTINSGRGNDTILGGDGDDRIISGRGNSVVYGGNGNDNISVRDNSVAYGGDGDDILFGHLLKGGTQTFTGGSGHDTFEFDYHTTKAANVTITDFELGVDFLVIEGFDLSNVQVGALPSEFTTGVAADGSLTLTYEGNATFTLNGVAEGDFFL